MELRVLRYFIAVAQAKTVSGAARNLHLSQPTLSRQLTELEAEIGAPLFTRGAREITLTAKGRYLLNRALAITQMVDKTTHNLQSQQPIISGTLDIGAGESAEIGRLMTVIAHLQRDYPHVTIHLHSGNATAVETQLNEGQLDFGVILGSRALHHYHALKLPEKNRWGLLLSPTDRLAQKSVIHPQDLIGHRLLVSEQATQQDRFQDWWQNVASQLKVAGTYDLFFNAALLVAHGGGYALAYDQLANTSLSASLTFRPLAPTLTDPMTLIWPTSHPLSPVAQLFLKRLRANLQTTPVVR